MLVYHCTLTSTAGSKKLTSQTEHIPALLGVEKQFPHKNQIRYRAVFQIVIFACILGLGFTGTKLAARLKIQAKMMISKTAPYMI